MKVGRAFRETLRKRAVLLAVGVVLLTSAASRFVSQHAYPATFADDFYYYLVIAESIARGHGSTYFGFTTNGYHPLWMLFLGLIVRAVGSGRVGFVVIALLIALLLFATYIVLGRAGVGLGLRPSAARTSAFVAVVVALPLAHLGLETALVVLALSFVIWWVADLLRGPTGPRTYLLGGLIVSACVLARSDSAAVVVTLSLAAGVGLWRSGRAREAWRGLPLLLVGLLPVAGYLTTNRLFFGTWMTASAGAKSLAPGSIPSLRALSELTTQSLALPAVAGTAGGVLLWLVFAACRTQREVWPAASLLIAGGFLAGVMVYCLSLAWLSNWPVQAWYAYPFTLSVFLLTGLLVHGVPRLEPVALGTGVLLALAFLASEVTATVTWASRADAVGQQIESWASEHPGSFAMGDMAGNTAWRLQRPFVQLEGLVMPSDFVDPIRDGEPLHTVLRRYDVTYYVTVSAQPDGPVCYRFREPWLALKAVTGMTGRYCGEPLLAGEVEGVPYRVFAVDAAGWVDDAR